eukprot:TRINITY_DN5301_c1_g1_i1.p1 TRINITY_DN5301_c1_g1~~TRINITY_DN5301_c1_g1_i1.p1  ORF type:complete len:211 (+),score=44.54 TRINITY_DN5301_c1_g1_i1:39-671(+)
MAREVRRISFGVCETKLFAVPQDPDEEAEELAVSAEDQQALREWEQQARQEREEDRPLSTRQHALIALGRAAKWRACVDAYMQEPMPQLVERDVDNFVPLGGRQHSPVPPAGRPRRPAPQARQRNAIAETYPTMTHLPDVNAQRVGRPAPKARQRSTFADNGVLQPVDAAEALLPDDGMRTENFEMRENRSANLPAISAVRDEADASRSH